jgi:hypothetical protein
MRRCRAKLEDYTTSAAHFLDRLIVSYIREPLSTPNVLALMRLLACMGTYMNCQGTSLDEAFPTSWSHTRVWTLIGVDSVMSLKVRLSVKTLCGVRYMFWHGKENIVLTLLQVCQSHWKGRALGSFSTNSMTSIMMLITGGRRNVGQVL